MYEMSEMAALMEQMYVDNQRLKRAHHKRRYDWKISTAFYSNSQSCYDR